MRALKAECLINRLSFLEELKPSPTLSGSLEAVETGFELALRDLLRIDWRFLGAVGAYSGS